MIVLYKYFLAFTAAAMIPAALAQQTGRPAPSDAAAAVPPAGYESAFGGYVPHNEQEIASWRDINDEAARIGGHVGSLGQSGSPGAVYGGKPRAESASPSTAPSPARPAMPRHGTGHK